MQGKANIYLTDDKTFYHHLDTNQPFGFVLLFLDAGGFADLINDALLAAHQLSVTLELFCEPSSSIIVFFNLPTEQHKHSSALGRSQHRTSASPSI